MHQFIKILCLLVILSSQGFASKNIMGSGNYWLCTVYDNANKQWHSQSTYRLTAINKAYDACKKQSQQPGSCKAANENCNAYIDGRIITPMWQCTALDFYAVSHVSNIYKKKYDAALAAKAHCEDNSDSPESCYVRLFGCVNLNKRI